MLTVTIVGGYLLILPAEFHDFSLSVIGTLLFSSNIVFWRQSGYFDPSAFDKPLLHTWSLGVEEQFYILFPIILIATIRYFPDRRRLMIAAFAVISLAACIVLTPTKPMAAFYLIPTRAWELLAGALIALGAVPSVRSSLAREGLAACGIGLIVAAIVLFDGDTRFPGAMATLPIGGAMLIVAYAPGTKAGKLLSWRPFAFIGLMSYSLYLWHWPLIVFARRFNLPGTALEHAFGLVLLSLLVGYLSYRFIEQPFRGRPPFQRKYVFGVAATATASLLLVGGVFAHSADGLRNRGFSRAVLAYDAGRLDVSPYRAACHPLDGLAPPEKACVFGGKVADTAVWGDSHGVELAYALGRPTHSLQALTYSGCSPAIGFRVASRPGCDQHNALVLRYLETAPHIRTVIVASYYAPNVDNPGYREGMTKVVATLLRRGKVVIVIGPTPGEGYESLPRQLILTGQPDIPVAAYRNGQAHTLQFLKTLAVLGARVLQPSDYLCSESVCHLTLVDRPILFDGHHLSMAGSSYLASRFTPLIWKPEGQDRGQGRGAAPVFVSTSTTP